MSSERGRKVLAVWDRWNVHYHSMDHTEYVVDETFPPWPVQSVWTGWSGSVSVVYVWAPK